MHKPSVSDKYTAYSFLKIIVDTEEFQKGGLGPHGVASERPLQPEPRPLKVAGDVAGGLQSVQDAGGRTGGDSGDPKGGGGNLQGTGGRNGKMKRRSLDAGTEEPSMEFLC